MNDKKLKDISDQTIKRYTDRFSELGKDVRALGWGNDKQQRVRFNKALEVSDFKDKVVLDIGCGFGDFFYFLKEKNVGVKYYTGWDINENLIEEANAKEDMLSKFLVVDLLDRKSTAFVNADIVIMLGLLNYNLKDKYDNFEYSKKMIKEAFSLCQEKLIVDFISTNVTLNYPKESFIFYHAPEDVLSFALTLTDKVSLFHDYPAIPQKEFVLVLSK